MKILLQPEEIRKRIKKIHGNKYGLDKINWLGTKKKITLTCPIHGDFEIFLSQIEEGAGCQKCYKENKELNNDKIIQRANIIHNNKYIYDKLNYTGKSNKVIITCQIHGDFPMLVSNHLSHKQGCPTCNNNLKSVNQTITTEEFVKRAQEKILPILLEHNIPPYIYDNTIYYDSRNNVTILCQLHGEFTVNAGSHVFGTLCYKCSKLISAKTQTKNIEVLKKQMSDRYNNRYDYSLIVGNTSQYKQIPIICKKHKITFYSSVQAHLHYNKECPICKPHTLSVGENEIREFLKSLNINFQTNNRTICKPLELDIYIPEHNLAIEYDGLYWHSERQKENNYHIQKTIECEKKGLQLIHIFEDEWLYKQEIVKSRLRQLLGVTKYKVPARKCVIKQLQAEEERLFLNNNHLQGYVASTIAYGLFYTNAGKEYLVSVMSFGSLRKNLGSAQEDLVYEMYRFSNLKNFSVIGGASKLFKHFIKKFNPKQVISFADRRWSINNNHTLYNQLGFVFQNNTAIGYYYVDGSTRINRFNLRKDILVSKYGCLPEETEHEFCLKQGWYRIYDCGNLKYSWFHI